MVNVNGFHLKKVKHFIGMECGGFSGELYYNKIHVCSFCDEGFGGGMTISIHNSYDEEISSILSKYGLLCKEFMNDKNLVIDVFVTFLDNINNAFKDIKSWGRKNNLNNVFFIINTTYNEYGNKANFKGSVTKDDIKDNDIVAIVPISTSDRNISLII